MEVPPYLSNWEAEGGQSHVLVNLAHKARPYSHSQQIPKFIIYAFLSFHFTCNLQKFGIPKFSLPLSLDYKGSFSLLVSTTVTYNLYILKRVLSANPPKYM